MIQDDLSASIPTGNAITIPADQVTNVLEPIASNPSWERDQSPEVQAGVDDITVIARYPYQMEKAQASLIEWAKRKVAAVTEEAADLQENMEIAKKNKWGASALHRAWQRSLKTLEYYQKIQAALEAGYCIVPNFPVDMIAIRTNRVNPEKGLTRNWQGGHEQHGQILPVGEGEYKNPLPIVHKIIAGRDEKGNEIKEYFAAHFRNAVEFPFTAAKPEILSATALAMADKVFDEIGVLPGKQKKQDPVVVGRVYDPRGQDRDKFVTFLVAWFVDTRTL